MSMNIRYRPEIDGLRALAVLAVVFFHAHVEFNGRSFFSGGYIGVDVFFVISGYLITAIILKGMSDSTFSFSEFYERRARRILPALFAVLITLLPFAFLQLIPWQVMDFARSLLATLLFTSNIFFWNQSGYFAQDSSEMPLLHTWSLAIEEQFYILFPLMLLVVYRFAPRFLMPLFLGIIVISLHHAQVVTPVHPETSFFLLPSRIWELLCGAALARLEAGFGRADHGKFASIMTVCGLCMIGYSVFFFTEETLHPGYYTLIPVMGTMCIIWYGRPGEPVTDLISARWLVFVGLVSYSFYLWHYPMFALAKALDLTLGFFQSIVLILTAFMLAIVSYHYVEKPFRKRTVPLRRLVSYCGASLLVLVTCSAAALITDGGLGRYKQEDLQLVDTNPKTRGDYVRRRFVELLNHPFEDNGKPRVLIIGDSYGQDLVNALYEAGLDENIQLSTYSISRRCGNLFVKDDLSGKIEENYREYCSRQAGYDDPVLQERIKQADVIWLASSWVLWQAKLLPGSIANLSALTDARILVLGRKNFGNINPYRLIRIPLENRRNKRLAVSDSHRETNEYMKNTLDNEMFIDLQELICNSPDTCPIFDSSLRLVSYDGNHLTPAGAALVGRKLKSYPPVIRALSGKQIHQ